MSELSSRYPPIDFAAGSAFGLSEEEWGRLVQGLSRHPNEIECAIAARLWADDCSFKQGRMFLRGVYREAVKTKPGRRAGVFDIGFGQSLAVCFENVVSGVQFDNALGIRAGLGRSVNELIACGAKPLCLVSAHHVGEVDDTRSAECLRRQTDAASLYSRQSGIPLSNTEILFDERYNHHPIAACGAIGIVEGESSSSFKKAAVLYVGSRTAREGNGFSLKTPVTDPLRTLLLKRGGVNSKISEIVSLTTGGLARGVFELAARVESGVRIFLNQIPGAESLEPLEILLSESMERFLVVVDAEDYRDVSDEFIHLGLSAVSVGEVLRGREVEFQWNHQAITLLPYHVLTENLLERSYQLSRFPPMLWQEKSKEQVKSRAVSTTPIEDLWVDLLALPRAASPQGIDRPNHLLSSGGQQASLLRISRERALAVQLSSNPRYSRSDPYLSAVHSVAFAMRSLAATGVMPVAAAQTIIVGYTSDYRELSELSEVVRGASDACRAWFIPILSDSVSFSRHSPLPTAIMLLMGVLNDVSKRIPSGFQSAGEAVLVIGHAREELGETLFSVVTGQKGVVPDINFDQERRTCECVYELIQQGLLSSALPVGDGGLGVALAQAALAEERSSGFRLELVIPPGSVSREAILFSETPSRFVISCRKDYLPRIKGILQQSGVELAGEGSVGGKEFVLSGAVECSVPVSTARRVFLA